MIHNELFRDTPEEEIPNILKQAKEIVDRIIWKAKFGTNLLGTVSVNHFASPVRENFVDSHQHSSPQKSKRSWHFDLQDPSPKPPKYQRAKQERNSQSVSPSPERIA